MSIADFYVSTGLDPMNHRSLENWIGENLEPWTKNNRQRLRDGTNRFKIDNIAEIGGWTKLERDETHCNGLDEKVSFRKGRYELHFFLDTCYVESWKIDDDNDDDGDDDNDDDDGSNRTSRQLLIDGKGILMKHVPAVFDDPTSEEFDVGRTNLVGTVRSWKGSFGFVNTYHGEGKTWGYVKEEYFVHQTALPSELKRSLSTRGALDGTRVVFDTEPTEGDKLDRAVNVRLWDGTGSTSGSGTDDDDIVTPLPDKKRRKLTSPSIENV